MRCLQCGHSNPESNKFCGECGTRLEREKVANRESAQVASLKEFELRDSQRERVRDSAGSVAKTEPLILSSVVVKTDFPPATPEEEAEGEKAAVPADLAQERPIRAGISGPSILGLGYETAANPKGFVYDKPRNDGFIYDTNGNSSEYLLDEEPGRSVSWRAWALLAVLIIAGGLGYLQWRANRGEGPDLMSMVRSYTGAASNNSSAAKDSNAANTPATNTATPATANSANPQAAPDAASAQQTPSQPAEQTNSATPAAQNATTPAATTSPEAAAANQSSTLSGDSEDDAPDSSSTAPPATPKQQSATAPTPSSTQTAPQPAQEDKSADSSAQDDEEAKPESNKSEPASPAPKAAIIRKQPAATPKPKPLGGKDPLILQAENYIQGRGRPKNCSAAFNLLRQSVSQGNPAADVKLGALYWSGTCVTQNKATAFRWFTRAHELEPTNRWIERSRNSMWASMSEQEKRLAAE